MKPINPLKKKKKKKITRGKIGKTRIETKQFENGK